MIIKSNIALYFEHESKSCPVDSNFRIRRRRCCFKASVIPVNQAAQGKESRQKLFVLPSMFLYFLTISKLLSSWDNLVFKQYLANQFDEKSSIIDGNGESIICFSPFWRTEPVCSWLTSFDRNLYLINHSKEIIIDTTVFIEYLRSVFTLTSCPLKSIITFEAKPKILGQMIIGRTIFH